VTFPASLSQVPASTTAQFPGNGSTVQYSEGVDVGYRWYDTKSIAPLYPFGFGLSYTRFAFSHLSVSRQVTDGTQEVRVSAVVTNTGHRTGSEVAQLYLGDPAGTGEPPRQLAGFRRVSLAPGASARVSFVLTPQQESWWDDAANGWIQTAGQYQVFVGDSSALADLPLRGSFSMPATPGARQVTVSAPSAMQAGKTAAVRVTLTAAGTATLHGVRLALQLPQGWRAVPAGPAVFGSVAPGQAAAVTFQVTPPAYAPNAAAVVHATATTGGWLREAGTNVTVSG
jgi:beta-glucosidase